MHPVHPKPKVRDGLLTADHSKRGRRFVTILDPLTARVVLLEPWEHAILVLCNGTRSSLEIAEVLKKEVSGEKISLDGIERALRSFERQELIHAITLKKQDRRTASPRTLAGLQQAYREWHKDPVKTGQILTGVFMAPFVEPGEAVPVGLQPTVALPDDDEEVAPVAVGTTLVLGSSSESFEEDSGKSLRSVLDGALAPVKGDEADIEITPALEPQTQVGSMTEPNSAPHIQANGAAQGEDFDDELELEENVAQLLEGLDDDFALVEEETPPPHKPAKVIAGETEIPRARSSVKPPTVVLIDPSAQSATEANNDAMNILSAEDSATHQLSAARPGSLRATHLPTTIPTTSRDEPTMRSMPLSEAGLNPTMVGIPGEGVEPKFLAPPRNVSGIGPGAIIEDTIPFDAPDATLGAFHPSTLSERPNLPRGRAPQVLVQAHDFEEEPSWADETEAGGQAFDGVPEASKAEIEDTTSTSTAHVSSEEARAVFERLRRAGLKARSYGDEVVEPGGDRAERRRNNNGARLFQDAMESLTAGDLDAALYHFQRLLKRMPQSARLKRFVSEIEAARRGDDERPKPRALDHFEGAIEDAIADGHCPRCVGEVGARDLVCETCGLRLKRDDQGSRGALRQVRPRGASQE